MAIVRRAVLVPVVAFALMGTAGGLHSQESREWHRRVGLDETDPSASGGVNSSRESLVARGDSSVQAGRFAEAGLLFASAAESAVGIEQAALHARAARAYGAAESVDLAREQFRLAGEAHSAASGWAAVLRAPYEEDSLALKLLTRAPESAFRLAQSAGAKIQIRKGNWSGAVNIYRRLGVLDSAVSLALENGDSSISRELAFQALRSPHRNIRRFGAGFIEGRFAPRGEEESFVLGNTVMELGQHARAISLLSTAVSAGDSTPRIVWTLGRAQEREGNRVAALANYEKAAGGSDDYAVNAQYSRGRLLLALRRYTPAMERLGEFTRVHNRHRHTPAALQSIARRFWDVAQNNAGDSVAGILDREWPTTAQATDARMRIGDRFGAAGDIDGATRWYTREVDARGAQRNFARYRVSQVFRDSGDINAADSVLGVLARVDSLGYYGFLARTEAGLPAPVFAEAPLTIASERIRDVLDQLDFLVTAGFDDHARTHVAHWVARDSLDVDEILALAEGLIERHFVPAAIRLGWKAAGSLSLNDIRVVRTVFPWPFRELIEYEAAEWDVDPFLVAGIIRQESAFDPSATSRAGAKGLMQLMPPTARWRASQMDRDWTDEYLVVPDANLHIGVGHFADLHRRSDHIVFTLAAYNAGGGNLARWRRRGGMDDSRTFVERIPFPETKGYVKSVLRNRYLYRALYGDQ